MAKPGETTVDQTTAKTEASARSGQDGQQASDQAKQKLGQDSRTLTPGRMVADQTEGRRDNFSNANSALTPEQIAMLDAWRAKASQIKSFNSSASRDGGADTQNGVYKLAVEELKKQHLAEKGWEALPVQDKSPLDKIGADIVLINRRSGDIIFLDPSSRRLDPRTGERLSNGESAKTNVPAIRQDGVVDALPSWFDKMSGNLKIDDPALKGRITTFAEDFSFQIAELTRTPSPFNLKDFPLPSPLAYAPVKDAKGDPISNPAEIAEIKAVSDWSTKKASEVQSDDSKLSGDYREYAQKVDAALNFTRREVSGKLTEAFHRNASRVIVNDAIAHVYPNQVDRPANSKQLLNFGDGNRIMIDNGGQLIAEVQPQGKSESKYVITGGDASEIFRAETSKLAAIRNNPTRLAEFIQTLPSGVQKRIASGQMSATKILQHIEENRNAYSAGGAGVERPLLGRVVERLAQGKVPAIRSLVDDVVPKEGAETKATEKETEPEPVKEFYKEPVREPIKEIVQHLPVSNDNHFKHSQWDKKAPGSLSLQSAASDSHAEKSFVPLTASEVQKLKEERVALEKKGRLTPDEDHRVRALNFAEKELTKPGSEPWKGDLISHLRKTMRGEGRGAALGIAVLSSAMLSWYSDHQGPNDPARATFGETW